MNELNFDPNDIAIPNGNIFGFPVTEEEATIVILPVPWEVTTSYGSGTARAPQAILDASLQLDFYDPDVENAWEIGVFIKEIPDHWKAKNGVLKEKAKSYIKFLEDGGKIVDNKRIKSILEELNRESLRLNRWVKSETVQLMETGKLVGILGGDHSVPLGFIQALAEKYDGFSILHIDAHADLRESYEGFQFSHASIMHNVLKLNPIERLVQVGIRDICPAEAERIETDDRIDSFSDSYIARHLYEGESWANLCDRIVLDLTDCVYISIDIDGLDPKLCPNAGTPVPGGLDFNQVIYLMKKLVDSGRKIIGFDLCEVTPGKDEWDANVGARVLFKLTNLMAKSNHLLPKNKRSLFHVDD